MKRSSFAPVSRAAAATLWAWTSRAMLLGLVLVGTLSSGCAAENKITKGQYFSLNHPDFWKVKTVGAKPGEATQIGIGKFSETVINEGTGASDSAQYEASQAEIDVRLYGWPGVDDEGKPAQKVSSKLWDEADLQLSKHARISPDKGECGTEFNRKYTIFGDTREPLDLLVRPGFRTIVLGTSKGGVLTGIVARVPYEQDAGLYCHNLRNMQTQLQILLEGLTFVAPAPAAAPAAAGDAKPAGEAAAAPPAAEPAAAPK